MATKEELQGLLNEQEVRLRTCIGEECAKIRAEFASKNPESELETKLKTFKERAKIADDWESGKQHTNLKELWGMGDNCLNCKPIKEAIIADITAKAREDFVPKPAEPMKTSPPDKKQWVKERIPGGTLSARVKEEYQAKAEADYDEQFGNNE